MNTRTSSERNTVLIADDDDIVRALLAEALEDTEYDWVAARDGQEALSRLNDDILVAVLDLSMPRATGLECLRHIRQHHPAIETIICTASTEVNDAVEAMKNGAFDYLTKPINVVEFTELVKRAAKTAKLRAENQELKQALGLPATRTTMVGESAPMLRLMKAVAKIASLDSTVMITGESGVGKGLLARIIHESSPRKKGPFVTVSCTALPRDLVEAELFGHEKGAFTGALEKRPGRVEVAHQGTLFLDEVGDMPLDLQPKLLTFLQERTFQRIGGNQTLSVDVRVIAATHQDLKAKAEEKGFRHDLYFRLNVLPLHLPPLRERGADIDLLTDHLLTGILTRRGAPPLKITPEARQLLRRHHWPGNVRELENVLERASAFTESDQIMVQDLPEELRTGPDGSASLTPTSLGGFTLSEIERIAIEQTLDLCKGNKSQAARTLGISEKSIYNKMKRLGISR